MGKKSRRPKRDKKAKKAAAKAAAAARAGGSGGGSAGADGSVVGVLPDARRPVEASDFREVSYWDDFFAARAAPFEWYGEWKELQPLLAAYSPEGPEVMDTLIIGCGNSELGSHMWDAGWKKQVNIDLSSVVLAQQREKNVARKGMIFLEMDMREMRLLRDERFDLLVDKGGLDTLMPEDSEEACSDAARYLAEAQRVLRPGGRLVIISLLQAHVLRTFVEAVRPTHGATISLHTVEPGEGDSTAFTVFFIVVKKAAAAEDGDAAAPLPPPRVQPRWGSGYASSLEDELPLDGMAAAVEEVQQRRGTQRQLSRLEPGRVLQLHLWGTVRAATPRYTLNVVDSKTGYAKAGQVGVVLVPQGREHEWVFGTAAGQLSLAADATFARLIIVHLNRGHRFASMDGVQAELNPFIPELAPESAAGSSIPYLGVASDIGTREEVWRAETEMSGECIVEDAGEGEKTRRLVFMSNPTAIQSEAKLVEAEDGTLVVDHSYLCLEYQVAMTVGLGMFRAALDGGEAVRGALIGLGSGALPMLWATRFPSLHLHCVELDPLMLQVAEEHFGFAASDRLTVTVGDGVMYVEELEVELEDAEPEERLSFLVLDADAKDMTTGITFPPVAFLDDSFWTAVKAVLRPEGLFMLNLGCRDVTLLHSTLERLRATFASVCHIKLDGDLNYVVMARAVPPPFSSRAEASELLAGFGGDWSGSLRWEDAIRSLRLPAAVVEESKVEKKKKKKKRRKKR